MKLANLTIFRNGSFRLNSILEKKKRELKTRKIKRVVGIVFLYSDKY